MLLLRRCGLKLAKKIVAHYLNISYNQEQNNKMFLKNKRTLKELLKRSFCTTLSVSFKEVLD